MLDEPDEAEVSDAVTEARVRRSLGLTPSAVSGTGTGSGHAQSGLSSHGSGIGAGMGSGNGSGGSAQPRRRFVRDGEVPVVILHPKSESENRHVTALADMARQRDLERAGRMRAEQALQDAQATIQSLQTRLAHAEMAHAESALAEIERAAPVVEPITDPAILDPEAGAEPFTRQRRGKPADPSGTDEPIPVKWWRDPPGPAKNHRSKT